MAAKIARQSDNDKNHRLRGFGGRNNGSYFRKQNHQLQHS